MVETAQASLSAESASWLQRLMGTNSMLIMVSLKMAIGGESLSFVSKEFPQINDDTQKHQLTGFS